MTDRPSSLTRWPAITLAYTAVALAMTWPLATKMSHEIAWDLGDPILNTWIMMWTGGQVLRALRGDFNALHDYWNGNIFYPDRLTIAYSEHLTPQMLQALPVYGVTHNIILAYNLVFLSTMVLSALAVYLLVRELTDRPLAAFFAGLAFAYAPYRLAQGSHLQVLSTYWMPLALYGFRRYFVTMRTRALLGASASIALQNLSCGYFLLFFSPFAGAYCLYEIARRKLWTRWRMWISLAVAAVAILVVTWPFLSVYFDVRVRSGVGVRSAEEISQFSADVYAFGTASTSALLEHVQAFPKAEGQGFPGFTILTLAVVAAVFAFRRARAGVRSITMASWQRIAGRVLLVLFLADVVVLLWLLVAGSLPFLQHGRPYRDTDPWMFGAAGLGLALVVISPAARKFVGGAPDSDFGFYAAATIAAALLALGPRLASAGRLLGTGPYYWLQVFVPGYDGIRVPARFLMLTSLFLAIIAGVGMAALLARVSKKAGMTIVALASVAVLAEFWHPMFTNAQLEVHGLEPTPRVLQMGASISPLYQFVQHAPGKLVLIEFPFGEPAYDLLAMYYAGWHRRPLVNGYSGFFPDSYAKRATFLGNIPFDLEAATKALHGSGATHAIVHESAFRDGRGHEISDWLISIGAKPIASTGSDKLFELR